MAGLLNFEWQFAEHEDEWAALTVSPAQPAVRPVWQRWWGLASLLLLVIGGGVYALERTGHAGWQAIEQDLQNAVAADAWMDQPTAATVQLVHVEVQETQALVQAIVTQTLPSGKTIAYQTSDVYAESAAGWQQVTPLPSLLGPQQTLATHYFQIYYYAVDAELARELGPRLDALYEQACANFGLSSCTQSRPIRLELAIHPGRAKGHVWYRAGGVTEGFIGLPSPLLLHLPVDQPAAEWLYQAAANPVVETVIWQLTPEVSPDWRALRWGPLLDALHLWQMWQAGGALASEREAVVQQFYGIAPNPDTIPACQTDPLWQRVTWLALRICHELKAKAIFMEKGSALARLRTAPSTLRATASNEWGEPPWGGTVALELLVEYAVARYGVEQLPVLVHALETYDNWNSLIPAVYGIPASDFEQGWQAYVAERYGSAR